MDTHEELTNRMTVAANELASISDPQMQRFAATIREAIAERRGIAAACHRAKWQFEDGPAFDVLHRIGNMALREPVAKRWLVEETLPGGSIKWDCFEHEHHARTMLSAVGNPVSVTPLFTTPPVPPSPTERGREPVAEPSEPFAYCCSSFDIHACDCVNKNHSTAIRSTGRLTTPPVPPSPTERGREPVAEPSEPFAYCCSSFDIHACDCVNKNHSTAIRSTGRLTTPPVPPSKTDATDAVLAWMVAQGWLDADCEYTPADIITALDDNAGPAPPVPPSSDDLIAVDDLAEEIRNISDWHSLGAGELAEALLPALRSRSPALPVVGEKRAGGGE